MRENDIEEFIGGGLTDDETGTFEVFGGRIVVSTYDEDFAVELILYGVAL